MNLLAGSLPSALASTLGTLLPPVFGLLMLGTRDALSVAVALVFAGGAGLCPMATVLGKMPWNRPSAGTATAPAAKACATGGSGCGCG